MVKVGQMRNLSLVAVSALGVWLFIRGFLLNRRSCTNHSNPDDFKSFTSGNNPFNHTLILIVDALRFDFAIPLPSSQYQFHNNFPVRNLTSTTSGSVNDWLIMHSLADAPTTTLQRLQALLTGGLPVFVDAGSNFQSTGNHLLEDNLVHQIFAADGNCSVLFVGDDTWMGLFPETHPFHQHAVPYPSLNVLDLDTVDYGCIMHLQSFYNSSSISKDIKEFFDGKSVNNDLPDAAAIKLLDRFGTASQHITIAHMLGVDHCGHRYGADHPLMGEKLKFLHRHLTEVLKRLPKDTLVILLSDHGMDNNGDHGGDSDLERDSLLSFYRTGGEVVDGRFFKSGGTWEELLARMEAREVGQNKRSGFTVPVYAKQSPFEYPIVDQIDFVPTVALLNGLAIPFSNLGMIVPQLFLRSSMSAEESDWKKIELNGLLNLLHASQINAKQIFNYLREIHKDLSADTTGLFNTFDKAELLHRRAIDFSDREIIMDAIVEFISFMRNTADTARQVWAQFDVLSIFAGCALLVVTFSIRLWNVFCSITSKHISRRQYKPSTISFVLIIFSIHWVIFASNSFIIWEDSVMNFLLQSLILMAFLFCDKNNNNSRRLLLAAIIIRIASESRLCREEQGPSCKSTFQIAPQFLHWVFESFDRSTNNAAFLVEVPSILWLWLQAFATLLWASLRRRRNGISSVAALNCFLLAIYWSMEFVEERRLMANSGINWHQSKILVARIAINIGWLASVTSALAFRSRDNVLAALIDGIFNTGLPLMLPAGAWSLFLHYCLLHLLRKTYSQTSENVRLLLLFATLLSGWTGFFWTGHQAAFSSIQFQIGLIGMDEMQFYWSGARVVWNVIAPFALSTAFFIRMVHDSRQKNSARDTSRLLLQLAQLYLLGLVMMSCGMTGHFRRHLMVWKVFTPRMMLSIIHLITVQSMLLF